MNKNDAVRPINRRQATATIVNTGYASGGVGSFRGWIIGFFFFFLFFLLSFSSQWGDREDREEEEGLKLKFHFTKAGVGGKRPRRN